MTNRKTITTWVLTFILAYGSATLTSCSTHNFEEENNIQSTYVPKAPDYNDATMWVNVDGDKDGTGADVFYVVSTWAILHDTITVTLSPEHHVLVVSGYSASEYAPYRGFLNVGDIHSCEPWLYSECLQNNINVRAREWRKAAHGNNKE